MVEFVIDSVILIPDNDDFSYVDFSTLPSDFNHELRHKLVDGSLQPYEEPQVVISDVILLRDIRNKRDRLLDESDWTQVPDSPANTSEWATYRQALRDITDGIDLQNVTWPTPPE
tara:strand:- start:882 stop:1226 length:345 start_codon:yes stop_codon:yes gene_type:complete